MGEWGRVCDHFKLLKSLVFCNLSFVFSSTAGKFSVFRRAFININIVIIIIISVTTVWFFFLLL